MIFLFFIMFLFLFNWNFYLCLCYFTSKLELILNFFLFLRFKVYFTLWRWLGVCKCKLSTIKLYINSYVKHTIGWWLVTPPLVDDRYLLLKIFTANNDDLESMLVNIVFTSYGYCFLFFFIVALYYGRFDLGWVAAMASTWCSFINMVYYCIFIWAYDYLFLSWTDADLSFTRGNVMWVSLYMYYTDWMYEILLEYYDEYEYVFDFHEYYIKENGTYVARNLRVRNMMIKSAVVFILSNTYFFALMLSALLNNDLWEGDFYLPEDDPEQLVVNTREGYRYAPWNLQDEHRFARLQDNFFTNYQYPNDIVFLRLNQIHITDMGKIILTHQPAHVYEFRKYRGVLLTLEESKKKTGLIYYSGGPWVPEKILLDNSWVYVYHPAFLLDWVEPGYFFKEFSFIY